MFEQVALGAACVALGTAGFLIAWRRGRASRPRAVDRASLPDLDIADELTAGLTTAVTYGLRTPLSTIRGASEVLLAGDAGRLTPDQRRLIRSIERNERRLEALVDELGMLFDVYANTRAGRSELQMADVVLQAWAEHRHLLVDRRATVRLTGHAKNLVVHGNPQQLQLAVSQLISNALTFSPDPARIDLTMDQEGSDSITRISDRGVGIPAHERPSVFDWFYRGSASRTMGTEGAGLGLTIAKVVVEAHRGTINLTSEEHGGTTVTITLPMVRVPSERPSAAP